MYTHFKKELEFLVSFGIKLINHKYFLQIILDLIVDAFVKMLDLIVKTHTVIFIIMIHDFNRSRRCTIPTIRTDCFYIFQNNTNKYKIYLFPLVSVCCYRFLYLSMLLPLFHIKEQQNRALTIKIS